MKLSPNSHMQFKISHQDYDQLKSENAKLKAENTDLRKGLIQVAQETVNREKEAARLEAELISIRNGRNL